MSQHSDSDSDVEVSTENELTPQNVTKYQTAGDIANSTHA